MQFLLVDPHVVVLGCCSALLMCGLTLKVRRRKNLFTFLAASWIILFGILVAGAYSVNHTTNIAKDGLQNNLSNLAKSFAVALKDAGHEKVSTDAPEDDLYWKLISTMSAWQREIPTVASVYTMRQNEQGEIIFICCPPADLDRNGKIEGENEELVPKGKVYEYDSEEDIQEILDAFGGESGFNNVPVPDDWGLWITATEPMLDETGEHVHAVLGVDFWGEDWNTNIQRAVLWSRLFLLSVIVVFFVVQIFVLRRQIVEDQLTEYAAHLEQVMDELVVAKKDADMAARAKSYFLANVSHEIRTPLNAILGVADILMNGNAGTSVGAGREQHPELVDLMRKSSSQLLSLIDDVLTFSSIEAHRIVLESAPIHPRQLIEDVKMMTSGNFAEKPNVEFLGECESSVPEVVLGDPVRIRQILLCLVSNAAKFTAAGRVTVRCSVAHVTDSMMTPASTPLSEPSRPVHLDPQIAQSKGLRGAVLMTESPGQQISVVGQPFSSLSKFSHDSVLLRFDVSDTGIGIDQGRFDSLFEMFTQGDNSLTRQFGGVGLGLNIVKGLVQLMNGKVHVESKPGRGSTFSVLIPVEEHAMP